MAHTLHYLGWCAEITGRTEEAEKLYRRALAIREKLGVDHPDVAEIRYKLEVCSRNAGKTEEAAEGIDKGR